MALPEAVAYHRDGMGARCLILFGQEPAAQCGPHSEQGEVVAGDHGAVHSRAAISAAHVDNRRALSCKPGERVVVVPIELVARIGNLSTQDSVPGLPQPYEPVRLLDGEGSKQYRVDQTEHGRAGAHPDGKAADRDGREAGVLGQHADAVPEIVQQRVDHRSPPVGTAVGRWPRAHADEPRAGSVPPQQKGDA